MFWSHLHTLHHSGTVLDVAGSAAAGHWLAAPAGLFQLCAGRWVPRQKEIPFWHLNTVAVDHLTILAAGLPHGLVRSGNGGRYWEMAWIEQTDRPITAILPSPRVGQDRVWLAGTRGAGILRSTDDGRHWELSNWGLHDFTVIDLAAPPTWGEREFLFAITLEGVYQSPNGGRAWRRADDPEHRLALAKPQTCAVSPDFETDHTVWVGAEDGSLFLSTDRGRSFRLVTDHFDSINSLIMTPDRTLLVATGGAQLFRADCSKDSDVSPEFDEIVTVPQSDATDKRPIFRLTAVDHDMYAARLKGGVWHSADGGNSWRAVEQLNAGRFTWLKRVKDELIAGGPETGLWRLRDDSGGRLEKLALGDEPVLALTAAGPEMLISRPDRLLWNDKPLEAGPDRPLVRLAGSPNRAWGVDDVGRLWQGDRTKWTLVDDWPASGPIIALAADNRQESGRVAALIYNGREKSIIGISRIGSIGVWQPLCRITSGQRRASLALFGEDRFAIAAGRDVHLFQQGEMNRTRLATDAAPIIALKGERDTLLAASTETVWLHEPASGWRELPALPAAEAVADVAFFHDAVWVLTTDGRVWRQVNSP